MSANPVSFPPIDLAAYDCSLADRLNAVESAVIVLESGQEVAVRLASNQVGVSLDKIRLHVNNLEFAQGSEVEVFETVVRVPPSKTVIVVIGRIITCKTIVLGGQRAIRVV